jgi:hypothetical protein
LIMKRSDLYICRDHAVHGTANLWKENQRQSTAHAVESAAKQTFNASFRQDLPICTSRRDTMRHIKGCGCCMCTIEFLALFFYLLLPPTNYRTVLWTRIAQSHEPWRASTSGDMVQSADAMSRTPEYCRREEEIR